MVRLWRTMVVATVMLAVAIVATWSAARQNQRSSPTYSEQPVVITTEVGTQYEQFAVHINRPDGPPMLDTGQKDVFGSPVMVNCSTCHSIRTPNFNTRSTDALDEFHQGLTYNHGSLTCLSCHNPDNYDSLRLADQSEVSYSEVMTLCAQCHGPQFRDYQRGAHGGMEGYWDLTKGGRTRNNCIDCHDPHSPKFPMMQPTFKPKDRFLESHGEAHHER